MASCGLDVPDRLRIYKFTKALAFKVVQIVAQSRQGKKITQENNVIYANQTNSDWFNLSIPDEPDVTDDTKRVLNGEVISALNNVLCVEISVQTNEGQAMVLELWTVRMTENYDMSFNSISTIYFRMGVMLKSTLTITRITPAYKMSRDQHKETYKIFHKVYGGEPNIALLGDNPKAIKVSELCTPIGTILIDVSCRTDMTILPESKLGKEKPKCTIAQPNISVREIMLKSDHFLKESPKKETKKGLDLSRPLTAGAFVDPEEIKELHNVLSQQLPPEPPMSWLLAEKDKTKRRTTSENLNIVKPEMNVEATSSSAPSTSKAIEVPKRRGDRYTSLMEFPFADGSPITELANFYHECLQAKSVSEEWTDLVNELTISTDSESLSQQLKMFEEAVPEFDNMVASMFSNSENGSEHS